MPKIRLVLLVVLDQAHELALPLYRKRLLVVAPIGLSTSPVRSGRSTIFRPRRSVGQSPGPLTDADCVRSIGCPPSLGCERPVRTTSPRSSPLSRTLYIPEL